MFDGSLSILLNKFVRDCLKKTSAAPKQLHEATDPDPQVFTDSAHGHAVEIGDE
jgi:hypothetical protein